MALDVVRSHTRVGGELRFAGGSCGNVLTILSFLGWKSTVVARIGRDLPGTQLLGDLQRWSVDTSLLIREEAGRTPIVFQQNFADRAGQFRHRFTRNCPLCGEKTAGYRPVRKRDTGALAEQLPPPTIFYFDRVASGNLELARRARSDGALVVFEPSGVKDPRLFSECLGIAHIFKYSDGRFDGYSDLVLEAGVPVVVETRGADGLRVTVGKDDRDVAVEEMPAIPAARLQDAAGSGDWCTAGLIHAILKQGIAPKELAKARERIVVALRYSQALASLNCAFEGARGVMYAMSKESVLAEQMRWRVDRSSSCLPILSLLHRVWRLMRIRTASSARALCDLPIRESSRSHVMPNRWLRSRGQDQ